MIVHVFFVLVNVILVMAFLFETHLDYLFLWNMYAIKLFYMGHVVILHFSVKS